MSEVNLKPFTLNSSMPAHRKSTPGVNAKGLSGRPVKVVERRAVHMRNSSRAKSTVETTPAHHQTESNNTSNSTAVCLSTEMGRTCNLVTSETTGKTTSESQSNNRGTESRVRGTTLNLAATTTEQGTVKDSPPMRDSHRVKDKSKSATDNPIKSLKQYLTVSLTRLSVPINTGAEKSPEDGGGRSRQSVKQAALTAQSLRRVSRSQHRQAGSSEVSTAEGNGGVREMFFKATDKINLRKRNVSESVSNLSKSEKGVKDGVVGIQTRSEDDETKAQQDVVNAEVERQKEKANVAPALMQCKANRAVEESKCKIKPSERRGGQKSMACARSKDKVACEEGAVKQPEQMTRSVKRQLASRHEEDIVIKQAKVLLSDILRKDESLLEERLYRDVVERQLSTLAFKKTRISEEEGGHTEINGGKNHCSVQGRIMRQGKLRPRAAKTKVEGKQCIKGHLGKQSPAIAKANLSKDTAQLPQSPATCHNPLPHESLISTKATASQHSDTSVQAHIQSNIPLKKRTFRSSLEIDSELGLNSVSDQAAKEGAEVNSPAEPKQEGPPVCIEESSKAKKDCNSRVRRTELQKLTMKKITAVGRGLCPRANEVPRSHLLRRVRRCKLERQEPGDVLNQGALSDQLVEEEQAKNCVKTQDQCIENPTVNESQQEDGVETLIQQSELEEMKPDVSLKILFKRRRGKVWQMQGVGFENVALKIEKAEEFSTCDPFKAIMDSVSVLNMEMEAAQAHVQASRKSKNRLLRLKRRGERLSERKGQHLPSQNICGSNERRNEHVEIKDKLDGELRSQAKILPGKTERDCVALSGQETKTEDRLLKNCCMFESGSQQKLQPEADLNGISLPVIKLRRKVEDIWEVDSKEELRQTEFKVDPDVKKETKGHLLWKQKGFFDFSKFKDECPPSQRLNSSVPAFKTEPPPFSLSLSPLSLSSPLNDRTEVVSPSADAVSERPEMNSGGRKQRHKMERMRKYGPVETPTTCLSHTLQQIDNSLSRLSEGLCSSQTLEKPPACPSVSNSVVHPPSQSPPFTTVDNMLSGEPSFTNCCDDILDFQCLNFEGYYQPQNILPSSPSDLCSLEPPTDPFSSPLSHSPTDTWTTETPYLGPPSPGNNFTSEDLQFFPGLISSKNDSLPLECEAKDTSKDRNPHYPSFSFSALGVSDLAAKDRTMSKNPCVRHPREDLKSHPMSVSKPRIFGATSFSSVTSQTPVTLSQTAFNVKPSSSQSKAPSCLRTQGPFHRMTIPNKSQLFATNQPNTVRGVSQSCLAKSVPSSQPSNKFLSPQLFSVKSPNPPDSPLKFQTSTVIHRVLKFQEGNPSQNLSSAPCKDPMIPGSPNLTSRTTGAKPGAIEKTLSGQKFGISPATHHKGGMAAQSFGKDVSHLSPPLRSHAHFNKLNSSFPQSFSKSKMLSEKHESVENNVAYKNPSGVPRSFFPSKVPESYSSQEKTLQQDKSTTADKHQSYYAQQDPFDFSFASSLSPVSQDSSPQMIHNTPPDTPAPASKGQHSASAASFPYGYQGPPYILNFSGDHSLTLGLRDGAEGCPGLGSTNYTYHCLMEPSGTQGRLVLEPCGPQLSNPASFSLGGFSGVRGLDEHCRKDMQQQCQARDHQAPPHYGPSSTSHSMGPTKPKRVRLVVTDGTVDLDLQYSD